jgi:hypothetical protein
MLRHLAHDVVNRCGMRVFFEDDDYEQYQLIRNNIANIIIDKCILPHNGIVYGGYVRDMIAKVPFHDIDCIFMQNAYPSHDLYNVFHMLEAYHITHSKQSCVMNTYGCYSIMTTYTDPKENITVMVPIHCSIYKDIDDIYPDTDVNSLAFNNNERTIYTLCTPIDYTLEDVYDFIKNKTCHAITYKSGTYLSIRKHFSFQSENYDIPRIIHINNMIKCGWKCLISSCTEKNVLFIGRQLTNC